MARVPDASQVSSVSVAPLDSGARNVARRVERAIDERAAATTRALVNATKLATGFRNNRQVAEDASFDTTVSAQARERFTSLFLEQQNQATEGAEDFTKSFGEIMERESERLIEETRASGGRPSDRGIQATRTSLEALRTSFTIQAAQFENNARVGQMSDTLSQSVETLALQAFNDPSQFEALLAQGSKAVTNAETFLPPAEIALQREIARTSITESSVRGLTAKDPELAIEMLDDGVFDEGLDAKTKSTLRNQAQAEFRERRAEQNRTVAVAERQAISDASDAAAVLETGRQAPDVEGVRLRLEALGTDRANAALKGLDQAVRNGLEIREFTQSPLSEQQAQIRGLQTQDEISRNDLAMQNRFISAHNVLIKGLQDDPFETAVSFGVIKDVVPIDLTDVNSLRSRSNQAGVISSTYGVPITPLAKDELASLEANLNESTPTQAAAVLANLKEGFGEESVERIAGEFQTSSPALSVAIFHSSKDLNLASDIIDGARILRENKDLRPTAADIETLMFDTFGDLFEFMPEMRAPFREAAISLYGSRILGSSEKGFSSDIFEVAAKQIGGAKVERGDISGGMFKFRGRTTLPPSPGDGEDEFEDAFFSITNEDLVEFGNIGQEQAAGDISVTGPVDAQGRFIRAEDIISGAEPISLGFGKYAFLFPGLGFIARPDATSGQAIYILDMARMIKDKPKTEPFKAPLDLEPERRRKQERARRISVQRSQQQQRQDIELEAIRERARQ